MKSPRKQTTRRLQYETLEPREVMAAGMTASLSAGVLTVTGTKKADQINFRQTAGVISIANVSGSWNAGQVQSIIVSLKDGNDTVSLNSLANGGSEALNENITVKSGGGSEKVRLANGHDVAFKGSGHTLKVTTGGTVTLDGKTLSWNTPSPTPPPPPPPNNWFSTNVLDSALRSLGSTLYVDGLINRADMLALFQSAQDGGTVDATEKADLNAIVSNTTLFGTSDHVWKLSSYVVMGNTANAKYQGQALGNLAAGSTAAHLGNLVNKWFLGLDRPTAGGTYRQIAGTLFVGGAAYTDVKQGTVGDCYLMASLAEVALRSPSTINNMFIVNGDGTYTVRFYNAGQSNYVTVDSYLPTNASGNLIYAGMGANYANASNELWVGLAEKAYVQLHEMGWVRNQYGGLPNNGINSYSAINGGYIFAALGHITGQSTTPFTMTASSTSFTAFVAAFNQGKAIGFASYATPASGSGVVGSHAYAVVGYNATTQTVTLFNPWGIHHGLLTLTWSQVQANFQYFDRTA